MYPPSTVNLSSTLKSQTSQILQITLARDYWHCPPAGLGSPPCDASWQNYAGREYASSRCLPGQAAVLNTRCALKGSARRQEVGDAAQAGDRDCGCGRSRGGSCGDLAGDR